MLNAILTGIAIVVKVHDMQSMIIRYGSNREISEDCIYV